MPKRHFEWAKLIAMLLAYAILLTVGLVLAARMGVAK